MLGDDPRSDVGAMERPLVFLLDTNVFIPAEPTGHEHVEPLTARASQLLGQIEQTHNEVVVHPELYRDVLRDKNLDRARLRTALANKYAKLRKPPPIPRRSRTSSATSPRIATIG